MTLNAWCAAVSGVTITLVANPLVGLAVAVTTYAALRLIDRIAR